jgi:hypothetical protein
MKIVNRGFMLVRPTTQFQEWAQKANEEVFNDLGNTEGTVYLIEEDFFDEEPIVEQNFKKILLHEIEAVCEDETLWPADLNRELFDRFFTYEFGSMVLDTQKSDLKKD